MRIGVPCRLGEQFHTRPPYTIRARDPYLTGLGFFFWESQMHPGTTLYGKRDPRNEQEHTGFYHPEDALEGCVICLELPDELFIPGYPLRELGIETAAVGRVGGVVLTEEGWTYYIYHGKDYGGPLKQMKTDVLDELFAPVLPKRVCIDLRSFLV